MENTLKKKVSFLSQGEKICGDLYLPHDALSNKKYPAIVVTGSWTSVKEQMAGIYAQALAARGFITLAFDFRNFGESAGKVRALESAQLKIEDIQQASLFLANLPEVAQQFVAGLSLCASSGYMAHAITNGAPLKAFSTVAAWLHNAETAQQIYTAEGYAQLLAAADQAEAHYKREQVVEYVPAFSTTDKQAAMYMPEPGYYGDPQRGAIPAWDNRFAVMAWKEWLTFDALSPAANIKVPTLLVHSDESALPENVKQFHKNLAGAKALYWMTGQHFDFYDQPHLVIEACAIIAAYFNHHFQLSL